MAIFVNKATGEQYEVPDDQAERARTEFGLTPAEEVEAEERSGGFASELATVGEEAIRTGAALVPGVDAGAAPSGLTELEQGQVENPLTGVYSEEARERRDVNPVAAGIGNALPAVLAGALLPGAGVAGFAATLGLDAATGYAQEAVDAELENRDIRGEDVLRNAGLNVAFSLGAMGLGAGARATLRAGKNLLERAAEGARSLSRTRAAAADGQELVEAVADTSARDELLSSLASRSEAAVDRAMSSLESARAPKVANNPNAQREAVEKLGDIFEKSDPAIIRELRQFENGSSSERLAGLRQIRDALDDENDLAGALDEVLGREDLWGADALQGASLLDAALKLKPQPGAPPEDLLAFADAVRKVREGEFAGLADNIEQFAERASEVRVASALGSAPEAASKGVDYAAAMKSLDPAEAWRLTKDGADEGLRKLEANTVSDALQRVDDVLKEDVAMSVKRQDFVAGAERWSAAQIAKQDRFAEEIFDAGADLQRLMTQSRGASPESGYALQGFAAQADRLLNTSLHRIAGTDPVTRNFELDQLKRGLHSMVRDIGASRNIDQATKAFGVERVNSLAERLRNGLTDAELFGRNAGLQSATNEAWQKVIDPYKRVTRRLSEYLGREFGNVGSESGNVIRFNPDQVERAMQAFDRNFRDDVAAAVKGIDAMMLARQQSGLSHLDALSAARVDLERIRDGFEFADLLRVAKSKAKEPLAVAAARKASSAGTGAVAGAVAGGLPGLLMGAAAGTAVDRVGAAALGRVGMLSPGSKSAFSTAVRRHLGLARGEQARLLGDEAFAGTLSPELRRQVMAVGEGASDRVVELAQESAQAAQRDRQHTARMLVSPEAARRYLRLVGDVAPALTRFQGEHDTPAQAFLAHRRSLENFGRDPEAMLELLSDEFGDVSNLSPKLQREVMGQAVRIVAYLQEHLPGRRNVSVVYPNGTGASKMEIRQFALRFTAATDPASVMADARAGRLQKVQLDTLQALWPREYDGLRAEVLQALGSGKALPNTRQRISILFGFGSGVDPALGSRTRAIVQAARAAQAQAQQRVPSAPARASTSRAVAAANVPAGLASLQLGQTLTF